MAIAPKVIDNQQLHLLSCLARAYGYHLRLMMTTELYEIALLGKPRSVGLAEELLAGGQGYSIDEAIENCFLDCKDQQKLLGTETCPWIEFNSPEELDVTLTLMGHHPTYEPVHMRAIDFNRWEVGPEDGKPIILCALPEKGKKVDHSAIDRATRKSTIGDEHVSLTISHDSVY